MLKLIRIARKCRNNRDVTRLWNFIDCHNEPEICWKILLTVCPWAFYDNHPNCIKFTY